MKTFINFRWLGPLALFLMVGFMATHDAKAAQDCTAFETTAEVTDRGDGSVTVTVTNNGDAPDLSNCVFDVGLADGVDAEATAAANPNAILEFGDNTTKIEEFGDLQSVSVVLNGIDDLYTCDAGSVTCKSAKCEKTAMIGPTGGEGLTATAEANIGASDNQATPTCSFENTCPSSAPEFYFSAMDLLCTFPVDGEWAVVVFPNTGPVLEVTGGGASLDEQRSISLNDPSGTLHVEGVALIEQPPQVTASSWSESIFVEPRAECSLLCVGASGTDQDFDIIEFTLGCIPEGPEENDPNLSGCSDGIDNDCDGAIDLEDPDCAS